MAVLWRNNENSGTPDASYNDNHVVPSGTFADKNTFLEKHVRVFPDNIPSETELKKMAKDVYDYRNSSPATQVTSIAGPSKRKDDLFGKNKPSKSTTYFIDLKGFQQTNAFIEKNVTKTKGNQKVPIYGGGVVVTYDGANYSIIRTGYLILGIRVGQATSFNYGSQTGTMQSKIVYHLDGATAS